MPSLLDPLADDAQRLVDVIAGACAETGEWPVWQYVVLSLDAGGHDADAVYGGLPSWQHSYRSVTVIGAGGGLRELSDRVALTVHGLVHANHPVTAQLVDVFLAAVYAAYDCQRAITPSPVEVQPVSVRAGDLVAQVAARTGLETTARQLGLLLSREPATWIGLTNGEGEDWQWDLSRRSLRRYAAATTGEHYLAVLEELVGTPMFHPSPEPQPLALPRAIDHLDVAWFAVTRKRLFQLRSVARASSLTLPAASSEEFESRCSALTDVLSRIDLDGDREEGALNRLKRRLREMLPSERADRAANGVDQLRNIVALRAGQQHSGAATREARAAAALGIRLTDSPSSKWDRVRTAAGDALAIVTEEVEALLPE